jgi:hypothetical protein
MKIIKHFVFLVLMGIGSCSRPDDSQPLSKHLDDLEKIKGKDKYLSSP